MVIIGKGKKKLRVTNKAYKNFYENSGWTIVKQLGANKKSDVRKSEKEESDEWNNADEDSDARKPLSEMNRQELEEYAAELGVDLTGLTSNKQFREAIKAAM